MGVPSGEAIDALDSLGLSLWHDPLRSVGGRSVLGLIKSLVPSSGKKISLRVLKSVWICVVVGQEVVPSGSPRSRPGPNWLLPSLNDV